MGTWATPQIEKLLSGQTVQFRPRGNSMRPKIESGQLVTVEPVRPKLGNYPKGAIDVDQGDIVLCKVKGKHFLHLVVNNRHGTCTEFLIGNNRGFTNGWTSARNIYGKVVKIEP